MAAGSLFSIPMKPGTRIVNASSAPALLLAGTTAPVVLNTLQAWMPCSIVRCNSATLLGCG